MNSLNRPFKLLLIDDDPIMVRLLTKVVELTFGALVEVRALTDSQEAYRWIENELVEVMITDLEMPAINGLELLRCVKRKNPCAQVLFITGNSTLEALSEAVEFGATDYLLKPLDRMEFVELVQDAVKRVRRWRAALAGTIAARNARRAADVPEVSLV
jgi:DNA-binding NtrC family response regulator